MATQLQIRRGTTAQMNAFTGAEGELAVNTSTDTVHVHDGATAGGFALAKADGSNIGTYAGSFTTISASGAITGNVTGNLTGNVTGNVTGDVTGDLTGSVLTAAQTNITSVGTLTGLTLSGTLSLPNANATNEISFTGTEFTNVLSATTSGFQLGTTGAGYLSFLTNNTDRMRIDSNGTIKSSVNGAVANLILENDADTPYVAFTESGAAQFYIGESSIIGGGGGYDIYAATNQGITFFTNAQRRLDIDPSGNLLVGTTSTSIPNQSSNTGIFLFGGGSINVARSGDECAIFNRLTSDGEIVRIQKDGSTVGSISCSNSGSYIYFGSSAESVGLGYGGGFVFPTTGGTAGSDNSKDLGSPSYRWDDIYATNGTIQTSDRNEKQDIEALSDAEQRVGVAAKGLLRKFRWIDSVEAKGDDARIHFGIIAQDLQAAFEAEGLDAARYAMFTSNTWWETQTEVAAVEAVEATEDTEAIEAVDAYTRTDTYDTAEEAPEGATERTRLGVRYSELLAFIIAAI